MTPPYDMTSQAQVDKQLLEQGCFSALELLLTTGRLDYADYERWRLQEIESLDGVLLGNPERIRGQLEDASTYAQTIGLENEPQTFEPWCGEQAGKRISRNDASGTALRASSDSRLHELISSRFVHRQDAPQLDMFFDNPVLVLVNGIVAALADRMLAEAERLLDQLYLQAPNQAELVDFDQLLAALRQAHQPVDNPANELTNLQQLAPVAARVLGAGSRDFIAPLWRRLAAALNGRSYYPHNAELHASYAFAQAWDWQGVRDAILAQPEWTSHAPLCLRMADACYYLRDQAAALTAWCLLCWHFPEQTVQALHARTHPDTRMHSRWAAYLAIEEQIELATVPAVADFPAWLLLDEPGLIHQLPQRLSERESAGQKNYQTAHRLLAARAQEDDASEITLRKTLKEHNAMLFEYLKVRLIDR